LCNNILKKYITIFYNTKYEKAYFLLNEIGEKKGDS